MCPLDKRNQQTICPPKAESTLGDLMTSKAYKWGEFTGKAYKKTAGKGFEVGFTSKGVPIFVGNFIHAKEATTWWGMMNKELTKFGKKYPTGSAPHAWYCKFLSNYVYKAYYAHLNREFPKHTRGYAQAVRSDERKFGHFQKIHKAVPHLTHSRRAA
jgi:hypothetical protein